MSGRTPPQALVRSARSGEPSGGEPSGSSSGESRADHALADRITEDILQLLYVVQQEIAEPPLDDGRAEFARNRLLEAIALLRCVADDVRGGPPGRSPGSPTA